MKKIYATGVSGTGKTTVAKELAKKGVHTIDIDDVCIWVNKENRENVGYDHNIDREFIDKHDWVCDIESLKKFLNECTESVVVFGITSNQEEFLPLFDKILLLQCKPETFIERIKNRTDNEFGKNESAQEHLLDTFEKYEQKILKSGAVSIDAEKPVAEVAEQIIQHLN